MKRIFAAREVEYEYVNIIENTTNLKEFLKMRDQDELFKEMRKPDNTGIGIPFFVKDGKQTLDIQEALRWENKPEASDEELEGEN